MTFLSDGEKLARFGPIRASKIIIEISKAKDGAFAPA
jgi:hypothetical protein